LDLPLLLGLTNGLGSCQGLLPLPHVGLPPLPRCHLRFLSRLLLRLFHGLPQRRSLLPKLFHCILFHGLQLCRKPDHSLHCGFVQGDRHGFFLGNLSCPRRTTYIPRLDWIVRFGLGGLALRGRYCNVPLHHCSGPRLDPLPRYPQPAPQAKLSVRFSASRYVIVPFFPIVHYMFHYVTVPICSIILRFYCTRSHCI